ncbi:MAG: hypothetical protein QM802_07210 [Agriterribacter sp.]
MTKQKIFLFIPLAIITGLLIYGWTIILSTDIVATWRHYVGLGLFLVLIFLYFQNFKWTIPGTGLYLLLATINLLSMTAEIKTSWITIGPVSTPPIQLLSLGLFVLFGFLNFTPLTEMYLDYKEAKAPKAK